MPKGIEYKIGTTPYECVYLLMRCYAADRANANVWNVYDSPEAATKAGDRLINTYHGDIVGPPKILIWISERIILPAATKGER